MKQLLEESLKSRLKLKWQHCPHEYDSTGVKSCCSTGRTHRRNKSTSDAGSAGDQRTHCGVDVQHVKGLNDRWQISSVVVCVKLEQELCREVTGSPWEGRPRRRCAETWFPWCPTWLQPSGVASARSRWPWPPPSSRWASGVRWPLRRSEEEEKEVRPIQTRFSIDSEVQESIWDHQTGYLATDPVNVGGVTVTDRVPSTQFRVLNFSGQV